ncbi:MAG: COG1361 S-layer family protein, partial [Candidatus Hydrothermarchaeaceae archaeon]
MKTGILIMLLFIATVNASSTDSLQIENIKIPAVIYPGDSFTLTFDVRSVWESQQWDVYAHLEGSYPFMKFSPGEPVWIDRTISHLKKGSVSPSFKIDVDKSAIAGRYTLNVVLTYTIWNAALGTSGSYVRSVQKIPLTITVKGDPELKAYVRSSDPEKIRAGDTADLDIAIVNTGKDGARNVLLEVGSVPNMEVLWFSKVMYVGNISPQTLGKTKITVDVDDSAKAGEYLLPGKIYYEDSDGYRRTIGGYINVTVEESAEFGVAPAAEKLVSDTKENAVTFRVKNTGTKIAEETRATLRANYPFTPTGNEYYIGSLSPGEEREISFHVDVDSDASSQKYPVDIIFQWKEDGDEYTKTKSSFIDVMHAGSRFVLYLGGIFVGVILIVIERKKLLKRAK